MSFLRLRNNLHSRKSFWTAKKWFEDKVGFRFWKSAFRVNYFYDYQKSSFYFLWSSLGPFIKTLIYTVLIILILELCNRFFPVTSDLYINVFDSDTIDAFLATIASISGVFLGLYFAAISSIAGNFLLRASQDIRHFFLRTPEGIQYVQTIVSTGVISIFYLIAKSFGHNIHPVGLIFLCLLGVYIIIRFWSVGSNVFHALEPRNSFPWISKKIFESIKRVTPASFQWGQAHTQNHQNKLVVNNMELLMNLVTFGIKEMKISDEQRIVALNQLGYLLYKYSNFKRKIPSNSYWFKRRNKFQDWLFANSSQIDLALKTGTGLMPEVIVDTTWFEESILDISVLIFDSLISERAFGSILEGFEPFVHLVQNYAKDFDVNALKHLFKKLNSSISALYSIKLNDPSSYKYKEQLAIAESQGRLAVSALLGLTKHIEKNPVNKLVNVIDNINWQKDESIYKSELPQTIISHLEKLSKKLKNEFLIEEKIISPNWYIRTLCIQQYLFKLEDYFKYIKSFHKEYFSKKFDELISREQTILAVHLIQRWREFNGKYERLIDVMEKYIEDCNKFKSVKDLPWPVFDFEEERKIASERVKEVEDSLINMLPNLATLSIGDDLPDYFGEALTIGVQACYSSCENNNHERLIKILPKVFNASLSAYEIAKKKVENWDQDERKITFSTEPLVNLLDISGYTRLYSELHQNLELWKVMQTTWDYYLTSDNASEIIKFLVAITQIRTGIFALTPQAILRTEWQMRFNRNMEDQGILEDRHFMDDKKINHVSPLIRIIAKRRGLSVFSGHDVFFATYLEAHNAAEGIEFPDKYGLRKCLEEENNSNPK